MAMLDTRIRWTEAAFKQLLSRARAEGWGPSGSDTETPDIEIEGPGAFEVLRQRLGLSELDVDALWLLACYELEPVLSLMASSLRTSDVADLTVSSWFRLIECATGHPSKDMFGGKSDHEAARLVFEQIAHQTVTPERG